jgi:hypothetical protein
MADGRPDVARVRQVTALIGVLIAGLLHVAPAAAVVPPFIDTSDHPFEVDIEWLRQQEITNGCGGDRFCPDAAVSRDQMASFLARAFALPASASDAFSDDTGSPHEGDINRLAASGITLGCAPGRFCPTGLVTRQQMASFLARAIGLPAATIDYFKDDDASPHQGDINRLATARVTLGCADLHFCPEASVTRGQMAAFLHRALTLGAASTCSLFPATNVWNQRVDHLPVAADSATLVGTIGSGEDLHPDFGEFAGYGIPYNVVRSTTPRTAVSFTWDDESDAGPYPIPAGPRIEGGSDRHLLMLDVDACRLYELFAAELTPSGWHAGSGAIWDLGSNALRPDGWTSADAAGLPILPGLVRFDEVAAGEIQHAIRFTAPVTRSAHVYPARHHAGAGSSSALPPMGMRVRLRADFEIDGFGPRAQVILLAMQRYGMILADNGSPWFFSGTSDPRWDDDELNQLKSLRGSDFEVVDTSGLVNGP